MLLLECQQSKCVQIGRLQLSHTDAARVVNELRQETRIAREALLSSLQFNGEISSFASTIGTLRMTCLNQSPQF